MNRAREILDRTDLAELLTSMSGPAIGVGDRRRWRCIAPDHDDDHPSVSMHVGGDGVERWKCWSDGRGGTAIDAVMVHRGVDAATALRDLAGPAGPAVPRRRTLRHPTRPDPAARVSEPTSEMCDWIEAAERRLWSPTGEQALDWLRARHLTDDTIRLNRLGFNPGGRCDATTGMPGGVGVVIPAFDPTGKVVSAQLRCWRSRTTKYLVPAGSQAPMPAVSFPLNSPRHGVVVVAEGIFDGLVVAQEGYRVAALTTTATNLNLAADAVAAFADDAPVVLALDGDAAGRRATTGLRAALRERGIRPRVLQIPDGEDLTSIYRSNRCTQDQESIWRYGTSTRTPSRPPMMSQPR